MFNKTDTKSNNIGIAPALNMISEGTRITGDIHSDNDIRISGNVDGEAHSKGKVIITSTGSIEGNIKAENADIAGEHVGELIIVEKLILRKSAVINGNVYTKSLLVEEGARITGNCNMGTQSSSASLNSYNLNSENNKQPAKDGTG